MTAKRRRSPKGAKYDAERAKRSVDIVQRLLVHTKGRFARKPFMLAEWQRAGIFEPLFGTIRYDQQYKAWVRQYRLGWIELGRGNGKSEMMAAMALILLCGDDEQGAEVYGAARDRDQAALVFNVARRMVELSPLSKRLRIIESRKRIVDPATDSFYQVIAADAAGNLGQNPHGIIFDEVIAQPNRELWDALKTGMGKRTQPLMIAATTAGADPKSFAAEEHAFSQKVARTPSLDPSRLVYMRNMPSGADPFDEAHWHEANPALGDFLSVQTLREEANEAKHKPSAEASFRQYRCNEWLASAENKGIDLRAWDRSAGSVIEPDLKGARCFGGLHIGGASGVAAWVLAVPTEDGGVKVLPRFFLPERLLQAQGVGAAFQGWVGRADVQVFPGEVIDYAAIRERIVADARSFDVAAVNLSTVQHGSQLAQELVELFGVTRVLSFRTTFPGYKLAVDEFERLLALEALHHGGNPVLRLMADSYVVRRNIDGDVRPDAEASHGPISGIVALLMALDGVVRDEGVRKPLVSWV